MNRLSFFPVPQLSPESAAALKEIFQISGFTSASKGDSPDEGPRLATLNRLFVHAEVVTVDEAAGVFTQPELDELIRSGLLHRDGNLVQSLLQAQCFQGLIFFSDFRFHEHAEDFVLPVGPSGTRMAAMTIRRPVRSALDLGCGCGLQSLHTAQHCTRVTAVDINPRAVAMTRLNADLNGVSNLEVLEGSYLQPVKGRRFDLILANLPYVLSPEKKLVYRNSSEDFYLHQLIREIPTYLTDGGYAQLLSHWVHGRDEPFWEPLERTLEELEMDAWLIHAGSLEPEMYVDWWLSQDRLLKKDKHNHARAKKVWLQWLLEQKIERIAQGDIILRRRPSGQNWVCSATVRGGPLESPVGEQLVRLFEARDFLAGLQDYEAFLETVLIPREMVIQRGDNGRDLQAVITQGYKFQVNLSPLTAEVILGLDGSTRLRDAIQRTGRGVDDDPGFLLEIQALVGQGMLVPATAR